MKVSVNRKTLLAAVAAVGDVVPKTSPKPILSCVKFVAGGLFESGDDGPALWATDLELAVRQLVGDVEVIEPGEMILPHARLKDILSKAKCDRLTLETTEAGVAVRGPKLKFDLVTEDPQLFPEPPKFAATSYYQVAAADLLRLIKHTRYAVSEDPGSKYALGGVLLGLTADSILTAATDGRRLSEAKGTPELVGTPDAYTRAAGNAPVLPIKAVNYLAKSLDASDPPVHLTVQGNSGLLVRTERATVYSRLIEGRYPNYSAIDQGLTDAQITIAVGALRDVVDQAAVMKGAETCAVRFEIEPGKMTLRGIAADVGKSEIEAEIAYDGPPAAVALDPEYLMEALKPLDDGVDLAVRFHKTAANVLTAPGFYAAIMPITLS